MEPRSLNANHDDLLSSAEHIIHMNLIFRTTKAESNYAVMQGKESRSNLIEYDSMNLVNIYSRDKTSWNDQSSITVWNHHLLIL